MNTAIAITTAITATTSKPPESTHTRIRTNQRNIRTRIRPSCITSTGIRREITMLTHIGTKEILTDHLLLRKFLYSDSDDMLRYWVSDPRIQLRYCEPVYSNQQEVRGLLDKYIGAYQNEDSYRWAITLKNTGECIGQIAFFLMDSANHFAEIEYCVGSEFHGKGLVTEACQAVIRFGFEQIHLHKIQISHQPGNPASKKVIEKCGFQYEGTLRDFFYQDGQYVDRLFYSMLESEYEALYKSR
jgi:[ribosomal protein S5]-alanine N-acetyltransferase